MAKDLTKLGEDTEVGLDIDGDGKPDFKINLRAIGGLVAAIIAGTMFYYQIMEQHHPPISMRFYSYHYQNEIYIQDNEIIHNQ